MKAFRYMTRVYKKVFPTLRVMTSLPRSGTHWLKFMISSLLGEHALERRLNRCDEALREALENEARYTLIYDHFDHDVHSGILDPARDHRLRMVLLYRNPLDTLISNFHVRGMNGTLPCPEMSVIENIKYYIRHPEKNGRAGARCGEMDRMVCPSFREYVRRRVVDWRLSDKCFPVRYEDLVEDTSGQLGRVADHMKIRHSAGAIDRAIRLYNFNTLSDGRSPGEVDPSSHYRKGVPGEWREVFDCEDLEILRQQIGDYLGILGYEVP